MSDDRTRHERTAGKDRQPLRFPTDEARASRTPVDLHEFLGKDLPESADELLEKVEAMIGKIEDLARELNCFGYFDDNDGPKAA
ncbi:MAG: hypothetical protein KC983_01730 [Phycisphaerales bacterium]|nr:hypothetical protein [Phycisphaerales bacterium]